MPPLKLLYIRIVAAIEVISGILGISISIIVFIRNLTLPNMILAGLLLLANVMLLCAGMWLWANEDRGFHWSRILQAIQIPLLRTPLVTYQLISGFYSLVVVGQGIQFTFGFTNVGRFGLFEAGSIALGINMIPILALWCLRERTPSYDYLFGDDGK